MTNSLVTLTFKNQTITPIFVNNQPYLGVHQIGVALQYARDDIVNKMYRSHADEFTPDMSFLTTVDTAGGKQQVRVFSLRGCHLLAMFSKTPVAKEFRRWVLDLIESHNRQVSVNIAQTDMKAIGGMVKKCCASAVRQELYEHLTTYFANEEMLPKWKSMFKRWMSDAVHQELTSVIDNIISTGDSYKSVYPTSDDDLIKCLWSWYATHHKKTFDAIREITAENDQLKCKLATIKKAVN